MSIQKSNLHNLCELRKWDEAQSLLDLDRSQASHIGSSFNAVPLTVALMHDPPLSLVNCLLISHPDGVDTKNELGMLPLRVAIRNRASADVIDALISADENVAKSFGVSGKTCLHLACMYPPEFRIFERLLNIWPEATEWKDRDGWHPLHLATLCKADTRVIKRLLDVYPEAAAIADTADHQYPLHIAALQGASPEILRAIHDACPDASKARTLTRGWVPLHLACHYGVSSEVIQTLLDFYRDGAKARGRNCGSLPLHLAARNGTSIEVLHILKDAYPGAINEKNNMGEVPAACAINQSSFQKEIVLI